MSVGSAHVAPELRGEPTPQRRLTQSHAWGERRRLVVARFRDRPPNAVLSFLEPGGVVPDEAVIVIKEPLLQNGELSYSIDVLDGALPAQAGPVSLFIDRRVP